MRGACTQPFGQFRPGCRASLPKLLTCPVGNLLGRTSLARKTSTRLNGRFLHDKTASMKRNSITCRSKPPSLMVTYELPQRTNRLPTSGIAQHGWKAGKLLAPVGLRHGSTCPRDKACGLRFGFSQMTPAPHGRQVVRLISSKIGGSQPFLVSSAYHWQARPGSLHRFVAEEHTASEGGNPVNFHDGFHIYAAEWEEDEIRFYVDDVLHFTVTETSSRPVFETPKNIILNLAVGGLFGGDPDGTTVFPQTMDVDYVRVWTRVPEPASMLLLMIGVLVCMVPLRRSQARCC